jgi:hypothetical protein
MAPPDLAALRAQFARAMRVCDDAEAAEIAVILAPYEPEEDDHNPRPIDAWGTDR